MKIFTLLRYLFDGPRMRLQILNEIKTHNHKLQLFKDAKDARTFRWIKREEEILKVLNELL
jgi:hypothetical protein